MKGRYLLPVVLTLLFPVSSCQGTTSGSEAPSSSKPIVLVEKKLSVKAFPKLDYAQYDRLDLSGLQIQGETYHDGVLMDMIDRSYARVAGKLPRRLRAQLENA